jgi:hypothetical protein
MTKAAQAAFFIAYRKVYRPGSIPRRRSRAENTCLSLGIINLLTYCPETHPDGQQVRFFTSFDV